MNRFIGSVAYFIDSDNNPRPTVVYAARVLYCAAGAGAGIDPKSSASWPFLIMCMISMPANVLGAESNDLKPIIGRTIRLMAR